MSTVVEAPAPGTTTLVRPRVVETVAEYAEALDAVRLSGRTVGVVPTMGALHDGHRSLIQRAAAECDVVAVSIFVNPTQFGDPADLANYPRTFDTDVRAVASSGGRLVFAPSVVEMYPDPAGTAPTTVSVPALSARWEGASRPGHFDGVATVVVKLLSAAGRCRAYFGEKDFQQLALVQPPGPRPGPAHPRGGVPDRPGPRRPGPVQPQPPSRPGPASCGPGALPGPPGRCRPVGRRGRGGRGGGDHGPGGRRRAPGRPGLRRAGHGRRSPAGPVVGAPSAPCG